MAVIFVVPVPGFDTYIPLSTPVTAVVLSVISDEEALLLLADIPSPEAAVIACAAMIAILPVPACLTKIPVLLAVMAPLALIVMSPAAPCALVTAIPACCSDVVLAWLVIFPSLVMVTLPDP